MGFYRTLRSICEGRRQNSKIVIYLELNPDYVMKDLYPSIYFPVVLQQDVQKTGSPSQGTRSVGHGEFIMFDAVCLASLLTKMFYFITRKFNIQNSIQMYFQSMEE